MTLQDLERAYATKQSHQEKTIAQHVDECVELTHSFMEFYNLGDLFNFSETLCRYHDAGKLRPGFSILNEFNPPHSPYSVYNLFSHEKPEGLLNGYSFLPFFILRHHKALTRGIKSSLLSHMLPRHLSEVEIKWFKDNLDEWMENFYRTVSGYEEKKKIDMADVFGFFKLADIMSASNTFPQLRTPEITVDDLKKWLVHKIQRNKQLNLKKTRLNTQLRLSSTDKHVLLKAPTGWGKTAASLSYAIGSGRKIVYVLPTITSIKNFYDNLCTLFGQENVGELFYYGDVETVKRDQSLQDYMFSTYFARPVVITTLDQLLLTFLQLGKYFMKRPHLRNTTIILDEVHTFSQSMLHVLSYFIKKFIHHYNMRFFVMSATFPSALRTHFMDLLGTDTKMVWLDHEFWKKRRVMFKLSDMDIYDAAEYVITHARKHSHPKISIICNTVEKAQNVYDFLLNSEYVDGLELELLHSRFIYKHRSEKEERINRLLKSNRPFVLVSTQVIEVSLDVSFDYMVTECAPLESLVQRFGRLNRYNNKTTSTNAWITFPRDMLNKKKYPYETNDIINTWEFLKDLEGDKLKNELQLVNEYDKIAKISQLKKQDVDTLLSLWEDHTQMLYSWKAGNTFAQKFFKFRDDFTALVIPRIYRPIVDELYAQLKEESSYNTRRKLFTFIKEYTAPVPFWSVKDWSDKCFPTVDVNYSEVFGINFANL